VQRICVQAHDGRELSLSDLTWIDREDAGLAPLKAAAE
jgi:hypothetical protein